MKSTQSHLSYLIFLFALMSSLQGWAQFDIAGTSTHLDIGCNGANDGQITLDFTNTSPESLTSVVWKNTGSGWQIVFDDNIPDLTYPTPSYSVNTATQKVYLNLPPASYFIVVTGGTSGEVETSDTYSIDEPSALSLVQNTGGTFNPLCVGTTDGQITVQAYGGVGTYNYGIQKNGGGITWGDADGIFAVDAGTYTPWVKIINSNGTSSVCSANLGSNITITDPVAISLGAVSSTDVVCFGESNGSVSMLVASGGTGSLIYGIATNTTGTAPADGSYSFTNTGSGTTFTGLSANSAGNSYFVAVQDDNGCIEKADGATATVTAPSADITVGGFARDNPSALSGTNGSVQLSGGGVSGGTPGYLYSWVNAAGTEVGTSANLSSRGAGIYTLTIEDSKACKKTFAQQTLIDCFDVEETIVNLTGFELGNGQIVLNPVVDNSTNNYTWSSTWENSANVAISVANIGGVTSAKVNGTTSNTTALVVDTNIGTIEVGDIITNSTTSAEVPGVVTVVTVTDQNNLVLSAPLSLSNNNDLVFTPVKITDLGADTYTVQISGTDGAGGGVCTKTISYVVTQPADFSITSLTSPKTISGDANDIVCMDTDDAYITAAVSGGTSPFKIQYKYKANSAATYSTNYGVFTTAIGSWDDSHFTNGLTSSNLPAGFYSVRLKDYNGVFTDDVVIEITEPSTGFTMPITAATALVNGAIAAASNTKNLVVDNNVGTIKAGDVITAKQTDGSYFNAVVNIVTDQQNLVMVSNLPNLEDNTVLTFTNDKTSLTSTSPRTLELTDVTCNTLGDGKAEFPPITGHSIDSIRWYRWTGSTKTKLDNYNNLTSIDTLVEGSYTLELGDAFGCVKSTNFAINEPEVLSLDETITNVVCPASSSAKVNGDYTGGGAAARINVDTNLGTISEGDVVTGTGISGMITVTTVHSQLDVTLSATVALSDDTDLTFAPPGIVSVVVGGATSNSLNSEFYSYQWDQGGVLLPTSQVTNTGTSTTQLTVTEAGNYTLTVTDFNGCTYTTETTQFQETYPVNVPDVMTVSLTTVSGTNVYGKDSINVSHPLCKDGDDGYILIDVAGGTPNATYGYRYSWFKDGATTVMASSQDVSGLDDGNYDVIVTDGNGCTLNSPDYTIASPTSSYHIEDLATKAVSNGAISSSTALTIVSNTNIEVNDVVSGTGISGVVTVAAVNSATSLTLSSAQTIATGVTLIFTPSSPTILTNPTCNGETGSIAIRIDDDDDGTHPSGYTYDWFTGQAATGTAFNTTNTKTISNLNAAYYTFQATDYYGCRQTKTFQVEESPTIVITSDVTQLTCPTASDAQIEIEASGGNSVLATDYTYSWKKDGDEVYPTGTLAASNPVNLVSLDSGIYIVTVADQATTAPDKAVCVATDTLIVSYLAGFQVAEAITPAACQAGGTSEISVNISGGTAPYTQQWKTTPGAVFVGNGTTIDNLPDDTYRLIITDNNNCSSAAGDFDYVVAAPTTTYNINASTTISNSISPSATATVVSPVTCYGESTGYIEVKLTADVGHPTDYTYAWYAGQTATGLVVEDEKRIDSLATGYYTFQATDANGCIREATYFIPEYSTMQISSTVADNVCGGDQIGAIDIEANGGNSLNYAYQWSKNGVNFNPADSAWTDTEISTLASGVYKVIVTDEQGCDLEKSFEISNIPIIAVNPTLTNVLCKDYATGQIEIDITGGNAPYSVSWVKSGVFVDDTPTISGLIQGTYRLTVVDSLSCPSHEEDFVITEPATRYDINPIGENVSCFEAKDGNININISAEAGHLNSYSISWEKDGELFDSNKRVLLNLNNGDYRVTITDDLSGCTKFDSLTLTQPDDIYLHPVIDTLECYNASNAIITLDPTGGSDLYPIMMWKYQAVGTADTVITTDIAFEATYLAAGNHLITLTDSEGCVKDSTIIIDNPANMAVDATITDVLCKDASTGAISVAMENGQAPYTYSWVANNKGYSTSTTIDSLAAGDYFLAVQDSYLCLSDTFTINVLESNNRYNINGDITRVSCRDSSDAKILVSIEVLGESTEFTYEWEKEDVLISESRDQVDIDPGTYTIDVKDNFGCVRTNTFTVENPDAVNVTSTQENILCFGDSTGLIALSPTGGWGNFSYEWERNLVPLPISESFGNTLPVGDYIIDVIDDGLCVTPVYVTLTAPDTIAFNAFSTNLTCYDVKDGSINVSVVGGVPEYTYNWAKDGDPYSQDINLSRLGGGNYELIITDGALCEYSSGIIEITEPEVLSLEVLSFQNNLCTTTSNGAFEVQAKGGTGPYLYRLNDGDLFPTSDHDGLKGGNQIIEIIDDNFCSVDTTLVVETDYLLVSAFTWDYDYPYIDWPVSFFDASLGPDIVNWSWDLGNGALTNEVNAGFTYVSPGSYPITLKVTNIVGCEAVTTEVLDIEKGFRVTVPSAFTPNLDGLNDYFRPTLENIISLHLIVYNKYGSVVYETRDLDGEWDGSLDLVPLPQDSYLYEITYVAESGVARTTRGKVAMLR